MSRKQGVRRLERLTETELVALQERLGYYFKDINLLIEALTHCSFSEANNDILNILGGRFVQQAIALHLILQKPDITNRELASHVTKHCNRKNCAEDAKELELDSLITVGKSVETINSRMRSAAFNAVFGAITVDGGPTRANSAYWKVKKWHYVDVI